MRWLDGFFSCKTTSKIPNFENQTKCCSATLASSFCNAAHRSGRLVHKRGAILAHQLSEARAAIRNLRLRLWDARPEWVDLEAAADHGGLGVVRLPCDSVHRGGLVQALHVAKLPCNEDRRGPTVEDVAPSGARRGTRKACGRESPSSRAHESYLSAPSARSWRLAALGLSARAAGPCGGALQVAYAQRPPAAACNPFPLD